MRPTLRVNSFCKTKRANKCNRIAFLCKQSEDKFKNISQTYFSVWSQYKITIAETL